MDYLAAGASTTLEDSRGCRAMDLATEPRHAAVRRLLIHFMLDSGADINGKCTQGNTPLIDAALMGHTEVVDLLLSRGAVVDLPNTNHHTALHAACFKAHEGAVRLLLAAGASTTLETKCGCRAMDFATEPRHAAVLRLLRQHKHAERQ